MTRAELSKRARFIRRTCMMLATDICKEDAEIMSCRVNYDYTADYKFYVEKLTPEIERLYDSGYPHHLIGRRARKDADLA